MDNTNRPLAHRDKDLNDRTAEIWLPVPNFEKFLLISNHGRIKRLERTELRHGRTKVHYDEIILLAQVNRSFNKFKNDHLHALQVEVKLEGIEYRFQVHRMMYHCFVEKFDLEDKNIIIKSLDGGLNPRPDRLMKMTRKESTRLLYESGRVKSPFTYESYQEKLKDGSINLEQCISSYDFAGKLVKTYKNINEASELTGFSISNIRLSCKWLVSKHMNFYWRYGAEKKIDTSLINEILARKDVKNLKDAHKAYLESLG